MQEYYGRNWIEVVGSLGSNIDKGLLEYDCTLRREKYGDNIINLGKTDGKLAIAKGLLKKKYIYVSILIGLVFFIKGIKYFSTYKFFIISI